MHFNRLLIFFFALFGCFTQAEANTGPTVFGWLEKAIVMPVGATVKMKLDSGALTSSIDAKDIQVYKREGKSWVSFRLHLEDKQTGADVYRDLELPVKRFVRLRGAGGEDRRPAVMLPVCIGDRVYKEEFTLRDRDDMLYPALLGRRTLKKLGLLDVAATFLVPPTCEVPNEVKQLAEANQ